MTLSHQILIIGGGAAGITVAAQLLKQDHKLDIAIIEPSKEHYYQPAWTLVGAGAYKIEDTIKSEKNLIPQGATWIQDYVETINPEENSLTTKTGQVIHYKYLVVCPGIQINWHLIKGLKESLGKNGVTSNYSREYAPYTWETIKNFSGGNAIFTLPGTPVKCPGAPQKIVYLADDAFRKQGVRDRSQVFFYTATPKLFAVPEFCKSLEKVVERKNIQVKLKHNLKEIKPDTKEAIFDVTTDQGVEELTVKYDLIHVAPPMSAPDFIKNSPLAVQSGPLQGWVDVNKNTMQHNVYPNVFGLGDASSVPTSKTAAAIRKQAPVVVANLLALIAGNQGEGQYNGYTCCPLITEYGKTIMAEFGYDGQLMPSFPLDPTQERYSMWLVKKYVLPWLYWNRMLKGEAFEGDILKSVLK